MPEQYYVSNTRGAGSGAGDVFVDALDQFGLGPAPGRRAANAARDAAETQRRYGYQANEMLGNQYNAAQGYLDPYSRAGSYGLQGLMSDRFQTQDPGYYDPGQYNDPGQFNLSELMNDPGYQFRLDQGLDAVQSRISAQGGRGGGNAMTAINDYAQGFASNEADRAFGRFTNQRDFGRGMYQDNRDFGYGQFVDRFNRQFSINDQNMGRYRGLADMGYGAAGQQSGNAMNYGQMYGNNVMGMGNAVAAGQVGAANARNQAGMNNQGAALNLLALLKG